MKTQPELKITSTPLDLELANLLGENPSDFLILCLDGKQLERFGTPLDTPSNRTARNVLVDKLNDRSSKSWWPEFFENWKHEIATQFGLSNDATAAAFHPCASVEIHRVCPGHSSYLHCAIRLFEHGKVAKLIDRWNVGMNREAVVEIESIAGKSYEEFYDHPGEGLSFVIGRAIKRLLLAEGDPTS